MRHERGGPAIADEGVASNFRLTVSRLSVRIRTFLDLQHQLLLSFSFADQAIAFH
jgi:hypothetical protein